MTDSSPELPATRKSTGGPGQLIRRARESASLSVEDLAAQLKLNRHTLDALERDDFATLTEPVYIRGYYRKLAKVLNLPEAELIAQFDSVAVPRSTLAPSKLILTGNQELSSNSPLNKPLLFLGMVVVALLIALAAFWATRRSAAPAEPAVAVAPVASAAAVAETVEPPPSQVAKPAALPENAASAAIVTPQAPAAGVAAPASDGAAVAAATAPAAPMPAATPAATAVASPAPANDAAAGQAQISLEYSKNCWTRIEDAEGKALVSGIIPAGEKLSYSGRPPFAISFGNALGVTLKLNGVAVDMSQFTKSNGTARFSLP